MLEFCADKGVAPMVQVMKLSEVRGQLFDIGTALLCCILREAHGCTVVRLCMHVPHVCTVCK